MTNTLCPYLQHRMKQLLCLHPFGANVGHELQETDHELQDTDCELQDWTLWTAALMGCMLEKWTPLTLCAALKPGIFCGYVNSHSMLMHTVPSHDDKVHVCFAVSSISIMQPIYSDSMHSQGIATILTLKMIWNKVFRIYSFRVLNFPSRTVMCHEQLVFCTAMWHVCKLKESHF
jgi:hypothetical protein